MNSKDDDRAFDYVAKILHPVFSESGMSSREELAKECMSAILGGREPISISHPAYRILELLAIRLMGEDWCNLWIKDNSNLSDKGGA